jgi:hypothetical protein
MTGEVKTTEARQRLFTFSAFSAFSSVFFSVAVAFFAVFFTAALT